MLLRSIRSQRGTSQCVLNYSWTSYSWHKVVALDAKQEVGAASTSNRLRHFRENLTSAVAEILVRPKRIL